MKSKTKRKKVTFRLDENLLMRLKEEAKKANKSLNSYVESILMEVVYAKEMPSIEEANSDRTE